MRSKLLLCPPGWLAQWLVCRYPSAWRSRYAEEMADLLADRPPTWADAWNLALHAAYAHLHPDLTLTGGESLIERLAVLMRALRSSEIAVFGAFVLAIIAWLQFGGLVDGGPYAPLVGAGDSWPLIAIEPENPLALAMAAQSAAVDLAFLAVLAGGVPLAISAWRRAPQVRRLFLVPFAAFVGAFLPVPIALLLNGAVATINLTYETPITIAYLGWFVGLAAVSVWVLARAIASVPEDDAGGRVIRFAFLPSVVATVALLCMLGATIAWGLVAHQQAPDLFDRSDLFVGHATLSTWSIDVVIMAVAAIISILAVLRGMSTRRGTVGRELRQVG
jgi:hypothetical protein